MMEGEKKTNKKVWFLVLGGLVLVAIGIIIAIVMIGINREAQKEKEEEIAIQKQVELNNDATGKCNDLRGMYDSGTVPLDIVKKNFEDTLEVIEDDVFKAYIIICYADLVYDAGEGIDAAVAIVNRLEPMLEENSIIKMNYVIELRGLYEKEGNEEKVDYYSSFLDQFGIVSDEEEER